MPKVLLLLTSLISFFSFGFDTEKILAQTRHKVERVDLVKSDKVTLISSDFANSGIQSIGLRDKIANLQITKVYYVYTAYKRSASFDQLALDRKRFKMLEENYPEIFINQNFEWEIIEQTGLYDHLKGKSFFHGFILIHRPLPTEKLRQEELNFVMNVLDHPGMPIPDEDNDPIANQLKKESETDKEETSENKVFKTAEFDGGDQALTDYILMNFDTPNEVWKDRKDFWANFDMILDESGKITDIVFNDEYSNGVKKAIEKTMLGMPAWHPKTIDGQNSGDTVKFELRVSYSPHVKGMYLKNGKPPRLAHTASGPENHEAGKKAETMEVSNTSPVFKSLTLLANSDNIALVLDVTGSMKFNISNAAQWVRTNKDQLPFSSFTVFNDGDGKPDKDKEIGTTGGIYTTGFHSEFKEIVRKGMSAGNGGDYPENDIEAILYAIRKDPSADEVLIIADNLSPVKDIELLSKVNKPVSVLVCALTKTVHPQYLEIILKTGGKLYYDGEVIDFSTLKRGDTFKVKRVTYIFNGRKITEV